MKKTVEHYFCDICGKETTVIPVSYPVIFHTEQTEGRSVDPYIDQTKLDICEECAEKAFKIHAIGAQGYNKYEIRT